MSLEPPCPVCDDSGPHARHTAREMMFGTREPFEYAECGSCGLLWLHDVPSDMSPHYPANYYAFAPSGAAPVSRVVRFANAHRMRRLLGGRSPFDRALQRLWPLRWPTVRWLRLSGATLECRILDVGCGQGEWVRLLADFGFSNVTGVDPFIVGDIAYPYGATVRNARVGDLTGVYDLVACHHAFEHMDHPVETLRGLAERLAPSGTLLIRIPLADSYAWETYGTDWVQLDAPRHLFLHTRQGMQRLGAAAGLELFRIDNDAGSASLAISEMYRRNISMNEFQALQRNPKTAPFTDDEMSAFRSKTAELNQTGRADQAAFYFRLR